MTRNFKLHSLLSLACVMATAAISGTTTTEPNSTALKPTPAPPHCEVPCGIYADQHRFEEMLEDTATIAKAITSINETSTEIASGPPSAKTLNQVMRWVSTKESHATNTQHIVAQYFLTQRIKADKENYTKQLTAAHGVLVAAMKCKQDAAPETAEKLKSAIYDLYRAYTGKEPKIHAKGSGHK